MLLAFLPTYAGCSSYYVGLNIRAVITATLKPVMAGVIAYSWWNESFDHKGCAGSFLILMSVGMIVWDGAKKKALFHSLNS